METLEKYFEHKLKPRLRKYGVHEDFIKHTIEAIDLQATSLLKNWDDIAFRKAILLLGTEEGAFYEPAGKLEIKCFVVVAIRNSPIETLQSDNYSEAGLKNLISNDDIKAITGEAIRFFNVLNFNALCQEAKKSTKPDLYRNISIKYPVAWSALWHCANTSAKSFEYEKLPVKDPYMLSECARKDSNAELTNEAEVIKTISVFDGYTSEIEPPLIEILQKISANPEGIFVTDSFKTITRNPEKLMRILEYLLSHNNAFASCNYYLENGHIERRVKPLKAAHSDAEMERNCSQSAGLGFKHTAALKLVGKQNS